MSGATLASVHACMVIISFFVAVNGQPEVPPRFYGFYLGTPVYLQAGEGTLGQPRFCNYHPDPLLLRNYTVDGSKCRPDIFWPIYPHGLPARPGAWFVTACTWIDPNHPEDRPGLRLANLCAEGLACKDMHPSERNQVQPGLPEVMCVTPPPPPPPPSVLVEVARFIIDGEDPLVWVCSKVFKFIKKRLNPPDSDSDTDVVVNYVDPNGAAQYVSNSEFFIDGKLSCDGEHMSVTTQQCFISSDAKELKVCAKIDAHASSLDVDTIGVVYLSSNLASQFG